MHYMRQLIKSAETSLKQVAATFRMAEFRKDEVNLDYGGGKYDLSTEFLSGLKVRNFVFDPFNRTCAHNLNSRYQIAKIDGAHTVTVNNVLNVIQENEALDEAIFNASTAVKNDGTAYFLIYEGNGSGVGKQTTKGWQRNLKTQHYLPFVEKHFGAVTRKSNLIIATQPKHSLSEGIFSIQSVCSDIDKEIAKRKIQNTKKVGKHIGGNVYVHRSAISHLPTDPSQAIKSLPNNFEYDVVKFDLKSGSFTFIKSPDFLTADEPFIEKCIRVAPTGEIKVMNGKSDPQIYHHKWSFVDCSKPDQSPFDIAESKIRSIQWTDIECDKNKIGTLSYWEKHVNACLEKLSKLPSAPKLKSRQPA